MFIATFFDFQKLNQQSRGKMGAIFDHTPLLENFMKYQVTTLMMKKEVRNHTSGILIDDFRLSKSDGLFSSDLKEPFLSFDSSTDMDYKEMQNTQV